MNTKKIFFCFVYIFSSTASSVSLGCTPSEPIDHFQALMNDVCVWHVYQWAGMKQEMRWVLPVSPSPLLKCISCTISTRHLLTHDSQKEKLVWFYFFVCVWGTTDLTRFAPTINWHIEMALSLTCPPSSPPPHQVWSFFHGGQVHEASHWSEGSSSKNIQLRPSRRDRWTGSSPRFDRLGEGRVESPSSPHNLSFSFT